MSDKPIIFSGPMVRAILEGRKAQTRRVLKPQPDASKIGAPFHPEPRGGRKWVFMARDDFPSYSYATADFCTAYAVGDRLWVREAHSLYHAFGQDRDDDMRWGPWPGLPTAISPDQKRIAYFREGFDRSGPPRWRASIHMPRWASRLTLTVTDVRVQRVQDISRGDCYAEGCFRPDMTRAYGSDVCADQNAVNEFSQLWNSINAKRGFGWDENPWVAAYTFEVGKGE